jgi:toluene monooxygenase electron transfer component
MVNFDRATTSLKLVIKQMPGGKFCDWLFGPDVSGHELKVFGPLGRATYDPAEGKNILCIAGGSGIAGMLAIIAHAIESGALRGRTAHVFFGVRTLADAFYMREFAAFAAAAGANLDVTLALSHAPAETPAHSDFPAIRLASGFVTDVAARAMAGRYENTVAFVAGPPIMVDIALKHLTHEAKIPRTFIRYDKFA